MVCIKRILIAHLHNFLFLLIFITYSSNSFGYKLTPYTLDECNKLGKRFCYTGIVPDRHLINEAIRRDEELLKVYHYLKPNFDEIKEYEKIKNRSSKKFNRSKRDANSTATTDCSAICCTLRDTTAPFSYFLGNDGWSQVASTPEYPIRVTFFTESCSLPNSPCRGVRSTNDDFQAQCEQTEQKHAILLYNRTTKQVHPRYISVPAGCRCRLIAKNPFKSASKERSRRHSTQSDDGQSRENQILRDDVVLSNSQYFNDDINV